MRSTLKKLAVITAVTATSLVGLSTTSPSAYAAEVEVSKQATLPVCYGVIDELGNGGRACINTVTLTKAPTPETGYFATGTGIVTRCVLSKCVTTPITIASTGASVETATLIPRVEAGPSTTVNLTQICVGSTCTPKTVVVPSYKISLFPPGSTPVKVCAAGICTEPVVNRIDIDSGDAFRAFSLSGA